MSDGHAWSLAHAVVHAGAGSDLLDDDDPGGAALARLRQELARRFLARTRDSEARSILDRLGVLRCRTRVLATIEHNARRAQLAPDPADDHARAHAGAPAPTRPLPGGRPS